MNSYILSFRDDSIPRFFESCNGLFVHDLKKLMIEFDAAATISYRHGLDNLSTFNQVLENLNVANEYDWFQKKKGSVPMSSLLYNFEPVDTQLVSLPIEFSKDII
jgi:hypothetical protein